MAVTSLIERTSTSATLKSSETTSRAQLIHVPSLPSIRPASSPTPSSSSATSSSTHLSEAPVQEITFRHGQVEDASLMTEMQFSNYKYHYSELVAKDFLDNLDFEAMSQFHAKNMLPPVDERKMAYVVAERASPSGKPEVIGMSQVMVPWWDRAYNHRFYPGWSQDEFDCEIDTLYVKLGVQGGGLGRKLLLGSLQEGYDRFQMRGAVIIWTLEGNSQARAFYKRIGCEEVARRTLDLRGLPYECVGYGFRTVGAALGKHEA
ncbi:hypothetical protein BGZ83_001629 [Gryganskiella cystojenkinii]|nr:hypothetical protein BGZ83_001629 [Gryganskiella cystojenkinii]